MKERNIQVNKLDTIAVLTISLIVKGKNGHKYFEFLLRESEAQREIKKVRERERQGHRETEKKTQGEKYSTRHRDRLRERGDRRQRDTEGDKEGHKDKYFLFSNCILSNEKLNVFQL